MKIDKNKLITFIISGVIIAGAGGYAYADQTAQKAVMASQSSVESSASSENVSTEIQSVPSSDVSSTMESTTVSSSAPEVKTEESKVTESSSAAAETTETSSAAQSSSSGTVSLAVDVGYYDIIDPDTGNYINARDPQYAKLQKQLGGDAGTVDPAHSTACQAALKKYIAAHPEDRRYTAPSVSNTPATPTK